MMMNSFLKIPAVLVLGMLVGVLLTVVVNRGGEDPTAEPKGSTEPLYWVAPMDPNYRRDKPGKSPMGMDLIPVYENAQPAAGTVRISPEVVNNLGVRTAPVEFGQFNAKVKTVGYVQYDEDRWVNVVPRVEGWIETLYVKTEGDVVTAGKPLYALYSPDLVIAQEELVLAVNQGNARMIRGAVERLRALKIPDDAIQAIQTSRQVQRNIVINAPTTGVVNRLDVREGDYVMPSKPIMSIADLSFVWVLGDIFERQLSRVGPGDTAVMTLDYLPGRKWRGEVDYVYPDIDPETRTAKVRLRFPNPDHLLKPGMFAQLSIAGDAGDETLLIPVEALIRTGDSARAVLALGDGAFKSVKVTVGRIVERKAEILSGLQEGDRVVTSAQFLLDSESSKTSDFARMEQHDKATGTADDRVWVEAEVRAVMAEQRKVTLDHEPISKWRWPAMTMDFVVADSVDIKKLNAGLSLPVEISRTPEGAYKVTGVQAPATGTGKRRSDKSPAQPTEQSPPKDMDHSQHRGMSHD